MCRNQHDNDSCDDRHPWSPLSNIRGSGLPWREVLARLATNNWLKIRTLSTCCGNYNEPGC
jgi:hypothetical protein